MTEQPKDFLFDIEIPKDVETYWMLEDTIKSSGCSIETRGTTNRVIYVGFMAPTLDAAFRVFYEASGQDFLLAQERFSQQMSVWNEDPFRS